MPRLERRSTPSESIAVRHAPRFPPSIYRHIYIYAQGTI
jgi:hypothetical protein